MSVVPDLLSQAVRRAARVQLWRDGHARDYLCDAGQLEWIASFMESPALTSWVWNIGRQRGKTFAALVMAVELCLAKAGAIVRYCAKTKESASAIVGPSMRIILEDIAPELRPKPKGRGWVFPNGSELVVFGTDSQGMAKGRGARTDLQLYDEAGFYQDLEKTEQALQPAVQTTGGRTLYLSTPALSLGHPYTERIRAARGSGRYRHGTFWDNPRVDHGAIINEEANRLGQTRAAFVASTYFRREYLSELLAEATRMAIPSWTEEREKLVVGEFERPEHYDAYGAGDWGWRDPKAWLFGFYDFPTATLFIEDELEMPRTQLGDFSSAVKLKERALYGERLYDGTLLGAAELEVERLPEWLRKLVHKDAPRQPYLRVGDDDPDTLVQLATNHKLAVLPTEKQSKHLHVDETDRMIAVGRVRIHPRCKRLIAQLYSTVWNEKRTAWERTPKDHGDLVDCLVYLVRNIRWHRDPRPKLPTPPWGPKPVKTGWEGAFSGGGGRR